MIPRIKNRLSRPVVSFTASMLLSVGLIALVVSEYLSNGLLDPDGHPSVFALLVPGCVISVVNTALRWRNLG